MVCSMADKLHQQLADAKASTDRVNQLIKERNQQVSSSNDISQPLSSVLHVSSGIALLLLATTPAIFVSSDSDLQISTVNRSILGLRESNQSLKQVISSMKGSTP